MSLLPYTFSKTHAVLLEKKQQSLLPNSDGNSQGEKCNSPLESQARIDFAHSENNQEKQQEQLILFHCGPLKSQVMLEVIRHCGQAFETRELSQEAFSEKMSAAYQASHLSAHEMAQSIEEEVDLQHLIHELPSSEDLLDKQDEAPIIRLLNAVFTQAIKSKASDIHIETFEQSLIVRFRIDGVMQEILNITRQMAPLLISRLKVMAKLDIAEKRLPQDGRISLRIAGHPIDVRISTLPSNHGERVVLRLLDKSVARLDLNLLGMSELLQKQISELIKKPNGIILVTGPTGSGKTTSLYAMLSELNQTTRNILTVEDPIEYDLPGIGQTQVNPKVDMTFAKGLRAILRQDPDIVMVGEIRDVETAQIAVQASLTGHLVLSTLHTNSAIGALTRLRDMGVETFLLSSTLIGVLAQRLIRLLCPHCKKPSLDNPNHFTAQGCAQCHHSGFLGRSGIYELVLIDETLAKMIHHRESEQAMENYIRPFTLSLYQDGLRQVELGETSLEELLRVVN